MSYKILDVKYELSLCLNCLSAVWFEVRLTTSDRAYFCFLRPESCLRGPFFKTSKPLMKLPQDNYTLRIIISKTLFFFAKKWRNDVTVEPRSMDTRLIRTVSFVPTKSWYIFSKITRFIRTPVNTDNGHFSVSRVTNSHILSTPLYGHWLSAHCMSIFIITIMWYM